MEQDEHFSETLYQQFKENEEWQFSQRIYYSLSDGVRDDYLIKHSYNEGEFNSLSCVRIFARPTSMLNQS